MTIRPYRGDQYGIEKPFGLSILVLGQSSYDGNEHPDGLLPENWSELMIDHVLKNQRDPGLARAACVFWGGLQSHEWRRAFWRTAAFTNYLQHSVESGPHHRPPKKRWDRGHAAFQEVLDELRPQFVLALGKELWRSAFEGDQCSTQVVSLGSETRPFCLRGSSFVFGITHPAAHSFTYAKWSPWVSAALEKAKEIVELGVDTGSAYRSERDQVKPARLLVAEDSPDNRLLVQVYLQGSPYQLTFATDGKAAVDRFAASDFDLILMDVRMPVMDGLAATRAIRALERDRVAPSVPIIALTANASSQDIEMSRNAGCDAHLSKPSSKLGLLSAIEKCRRQ
jgi:CheY-like chemotaxis protein